MARERNESGQYVETVDSDGVLGVFERVAGPAITSSDVSDELNCTTEAARQKLGELAESGVLKVRATGPVKIYWRTGNRREQHESNDSGEGGDTETVYDPTAEF